MAWIKGDREALLAQRLEFGLLAIDGVADSISFRRGDLDWSTHATRESITHNLFCFGDFHAPMRQVLIEWMKSHGYLGPEKQHLIEIGANIGAPTLLLARETGLKVLALEPLPDNFELLERNVQRNGLADQVTCVRAAVSTESGTLSMVRHPKSGRSEVLEAGRAQGFGELTEGCKVVDSVACLPLNAVLTDHHIDPAAVSFVWSDVQGFEGHVIASGSKLWNAGVPLFAELWIPGLEAHGGFDKFLETTQEHFGSYLLSEHLLAEGADAVPRDIETLGAAMSAVRGHTDGLLIPRATG
ncbi:MAG: FkbM family methyltransferase [Pseudohongiellaceae bacterium]|jgi:FkbM family methyltransferase